MKATYNKGVALIQVLLLSAILTILAIQLNNSAKQNTAIASAFNDKVNAEIRQRDAEAVLLFDLLTKQQSNISEFNYYGSAFTFDDYTSIKVQDTAGLINLHYPNSFIFKRLAENYGLSFSQRETLVDQLKDWQDADSTLSTFGAEADYYAQYGYQPTNTYMTNKHQVTALLAMDNTLYEGLKPLLSVTSFSSFNPYHAPGGLIELMYSPPIAQQILTLRQNGQMSKMLFSELTDTEEGEGTSFIVSPYLQISFTTRIGEAQFNKEIIFELVPFFKKGNPAVSKLHVRVE